MKNGLIFLVIALVAAMLIWTYLPKRDETKTVIDFDQPTAEVSEDTSLEAIEQELTDTEILDFEQELEALDKDINQL